MLACYPYTPANRSDAPALARTHLMYLASVDSLHPSSINHTDAHTSSLETRGNDGEYESVKWSGNDVCGS